MSETTYRGLALRVHVHQGTPVPRPVHLSAEVRSHGSPQLRGPAATGRARTEPPPGIGAPGAGLELGHAQCVISQWVERKRGGGAKRLQDSPTSTIADFHEGGARE